jgi:hypothetical protein
MTEINGSGKIKALFIGAIVGMLILIASIYWPPAMSVSVPWALTGLAITGICCAIAVREIKISLTKYADEIKAHSTPLNKALFWLARGVLAIGMICLIYGLSLAENVPKSVIGLTDIQILAGVITAELEFLYCIVGLFILVFGLFIEYARIRNIIWYMKLNAG